MASLSAYFKEDTTLYPTSGIKFYVFDESKATAFVQDCLVPFRDAYLSEEKLQSLTMKYGTTRADEIKERIPDPGEVMSGDFGEILSFYLAREIWVPEANIFPMKWRFKDKKKAPSNYTDIILFKLSDVNAFNPDDAMYTFEVKTRATAISSTSTYKVHKKKAYITYKDGKKECTLLEAVCDANKDAIERAAETIPYLKTRCKDLDLDELYHQINRFSNPVAHPYLKEHHAVAVIDSDHLSIQLSNLPSDLLSAHPLVKRVYCVPIASLRQRYEEVFSNIITNA